MRFKDRVIELLAKINAISMDADLNNQAKLPENCWFLSTKEIVCFERKQGDSRYPYDRGGLSFWAHSGGGLRIFEGSLNIILDCFLARTSPNLCFFVGEKQGKNYVPISLTGAGKFPIEEDVKRFTVFSSEAVYYFVVTKHWTGCVRMFVDDNKILRFSVCIINGDREAETYVSCYFNPILRHTKSESYATKWTKSCQYTKDGGFHFKVVEGIFRSNHRVYHANMVLSERDREIHATTSYTDFAGSMHNPVNCSTALQTGYFEEQACYTEFTDNAIAATIIPLRLQAHQYYEVSYSVALSVFDTENDKFDIHQFSNTSSIDTLAYQRKQHEYTEIPEIVFSGSSVGGISDTAFNYFINSVFRQVEFCTRSNYYGASYYLGVRDIFQQIDAALCWIPGYCREKIISLLGFIGENGQTPRQITYPENINQIPEMDLREFVDQGLWIISTVYCYLSYTEDFSILDEECGYYRFEENKVLFSEKQDSVLDHMRCITEYLISNLDAKTDCLHILYGDWNDALDGLGASLDNSSKYGSGVSVMATLQLYQSLLQMHEIMQKLNKSDESLKYLRIAKRVASGLQRFAIDTNHSGSRKIIHGWGDEYTYKVGSWNDNDHMPRYSLTPNAFWILSGMIDSDTSIKSDILEAYERLDSKYGYKTFEPYFKIDNECVGRIPLLPRGTAENAASYIHATLFAVWSLFEIGEVDIAWEQIEKVLPITHKRLTHSPFVMPNSYCYDEEKGFDGESMNDWFTGSACVLVKILLWEVLGIKADLNGVTICPAKKIPFDAIEATLKLKGGILTLQYKKHAGERKFYMNGVEVSAELNKRNNTTQLYLKSELLSNNTTHITVLGG